MKRTATSRVLACAVAGGLVFGVVPMTAASAAPTTAAVSAAQTSVASAKATFERSMSAWDESADAAEGIVSFNDEKARVVKAQQVVATSTSSSTITNYAVGVKRLAAAVDAKVELREYKVAFELVYSAWELTLADAEAHDVTFPASWVTRVETAKTGVAGTTNLASIQNWIYGVGNLTSRLQYWTDEPGTLVVRQHAFDEAVAAWDIVERRATGKIEFSAQKARVDRAKRVVATATESETVRNFTSGVRILTRDVSDRLGIAVPTPVAANATFEAAMDAWDESAAAADGIVSFNDEKARVVKAQQVVATSTNSSVIANYSVGVKRLAAAVDTKVAVRAYKIGFGLVAGAWDLTVADAEANGVAVPESWATRVERAKDGVAATSNLASIQNWTIGVGNIATWLQARIDEPGDLLVAHQAFDEAAAAWDALERRATGKIEFSAEKARVDRAKRVVEASSDLYVVRDFTNGVRRLTRDVSERLAGAS